MSVCIRLLWSAKAGSTITKSHTNDYRCMSLTHFWKFYMNWFKATMCIATTTLCRLLNVLLNVSLQNCFWAFELSGSKLPYGPLNLRNIVPVVFSLPKCLFGTAYSEDFIICKYIYHAHATYLTVIWKYAFVSEILHHIVL